MNWKSLTLATLGFAALAFGGRQASAQNLQVTNIASGMSSPLFMCQPPGDSTRMMVCEQGGRVRLIKNGVLQAGSFLDISANTVGSGESGLLGMAFDPDYQTNGKFYVCYMDELLQTHLVQYTVTADPEVAVHGEAHLGRTVRQLD